MDKLKLAHEYFLKVISNPTVTLRAEDLHSIQHNAWVYADAMQAEADKREDKTRPEVLEEWQPDWSQAPNGYNWFCVGGCSGVGYFCNIEPVIYKDHYWFVGEDVKIVIDHNYQDNWQNSLRKRPQ